MELYHSKGEYLFLGVHPCGSDLEEVIAQTEVQTVKANRVLVLMIIIT